MRLEPEVREAIVTAIKAADPAARIWLFGSRVDDSAAFFARGRERTQAG